MTFDLADMGGSEISNFKSMGHALTGLGQELHRKEVLGLLCLPLGLGVMKNQEQLRK